jgi:hypothetical protein
MSFNLAMKEGDPAAVAIGQAAVREGPKRGQVLRPKLPRRHRLQVQDPVRGLELERPMQGRTLKSSTVTELRCQTALISSARRRELKSFPIVPDRVRTHLRALAVDLQVRGRNRHRAQTRIRVPADQVPISRARHLANPENDQTRALARRGRSLRRLSPNNLAPISRRAPKFAF